MKTQSFKDQPRTCKIEDISYGQSCVSLQPSRQPFPIASLPFHESMKLPTYSSQNQEGNC